MSVSRVGTSTRSQWTRVPSGKRAGPSRLKQLLSRAAAAAPSWRSDAIAPTYRRYRGCYPSAAAVRTQQDCRLRAICRGERPPGSLVARASEAAVCRNGLDNLRTRRGGATLGQRDPSVRPSNRRRCRMSTR